MAVNDYEREKEIVSREVLCCCTDLMIALSDSLCYDYTSFFEKLYDIHGNWEDEILEWWMVDRYLGKDLAEQGELVFIGSMYAIWGRKTSGQAIFLDQVITDIADVREKRLKNILKSN